MPSTDDTPTLHSAPTHATTAPRAHLAAFAASVAALLLVVLLSTSIGAGASDDDATTEAAGQAGVATETSAHDPSEFRTAESTDDAVCEGGELTIGELAAIDEVWQANQDVYAEQAAAWQADARLTSLSAICWLDPDPEITASYYSPESDGYFNAPDGDEIPINLCEAELEPAAVSFSTLRDRLVDAGYDESILLAGVGLDCTKEFFDLPGDRFYYDVAVMTEGNEAAISLVVDAETGEVGRATMPGEATAEATVNDDPSA